MKYEAVAIKQLKDNANWYLGLGIALVITGIFALVYSFYTTIISIIYLGALIACFGIFEAIKSFKVNKWSSFFLHLFLGILFVVGGIFIMLDPTINALNLTLLLAIFFVISGIARITIGISQDIPHRGLILFNGILTLILGILIWRQWPYSGLWVIGFFVGIDMIFTGLTWIQLSFIAKKITTQLNKR